LIRISHVIPLSHTSWVLLDQERVQHPHITQARVFVTDPFERRTSVVGSTMGSIVMFACHTARLVLRDLIEDDWTTIFAMSQSPAVTRYQSWLRLTSEIDAQQWVHQAMHHYQLSPRQAYNLAIVQQDTRAVIGWIGWGLPSDRALGDYDFGYALLPSAWGQGYMTEALQSAINYMFESLAANVVYGECASSNRASARVMEKNGMILVSQWSESDATTGTSEIHERYAVQVEAWRQVHAHIVMPYRIGDI
jgi:RimJ/RimL family protein N-acetyltransferase